MINSSITNLFAYKAFKLFLLTPLYHYLKRLLISLSKPITCSLSNDFLGHCVRKTIKYYFYHINIKFIRFDSKYKCVNNNLFFPFQNIDLTYLFYSLLLHCYFERKRGELL